MTLSTKVLLGLALGIFTGIFFGEMVAPLRVGGEVFIQLLQMTVLPYVVTWCAITSLGSSRIASRKCPMAESF